MHGFEIGLPTSGTTKVIMVVEFHNESGEINWFLHPPWRFFMVSCETSEVGAIKIGHSFTKYLSFECGKKIYIPDFRTQKLTLKSEHKWWRTWGKQSTWQVDSYIWDIFSHYLDVTMLYCPIRTVIQRIVVCCSISTELLQPPS